MAPSSKLFLCLAMLAICTSNVVAHGHLAWPKARNVLHNSNYCPHCLNAGGPGKTKTGSWSSGSRHGICGDPYDGDSAHEAGGKFATSDFTGIYEEGGLIHIAAAMSTYHKGSIEYRICRYPSGSDDEERRALTEDCLDEHRLVQADVPGAQAPGNRWYFLGNATDEYFDTPKLYHHTFQLPDDLTCVGFEWKCVLQMHWVTGNTCSEAAIPERYRDRTLPTCGSSGASWPEEFWNCADIRILRKGVPTQGNTDWPDFSSASFTGGGGNLRSGKSASTQEEAHIATRMSAKTLEKSLKSKRRAAARRALA